MRFDDIIKEWAKLNNYGPFQYDDLDENEKYCAVMTTNYSAGAGMVYEYNHHDDNHCILPDFLSHILSCVSQFRSIDEHAKFLEENEIASFSRSLVCLKELWDLGLLMSQNYFLEQIARKKYESKTPEINTIGWITRDRVNALKKSLRSYLQNLQGHRQGINFLVFDDSTEENFNKNKHRVLELNEKYQTNIKLIGNKERRALCKDLSEALKSRVPKHVINYSLFGLEHLNERYGANRNAFLIYTTGQMAIATDDDILCKIVNCGADNRLSLASGGSEYTVRFFRNSKELTNEINFTHSDPVTLHSKLLGSAVNNQILSYARSLSLDGMGAKYIQENLASEKFVRITCLGSVGDSGLGHPISRLFYPSNSLPSLIGNKGHFLEKFQSRLELRSYDCLTIETPNLMTSMNIGIDNTRLLPPFPPNLRNEDGIFTALLRTCFTDACIGHLPYAIAHDPPSPRFNDLSGLTSTSVRVCDIMITSIYEYVFNASTLTNKDRLIALGDNFLKQSNGSDAHWKQYVELNIVKFHISLIRHLESLLNQYKHLNEQWAEFIEIRAETLTTYLNSGKLSIKIDDLNQFPTEYQLNMLRAIFRNFGELLTCWPEIYSYVLDSKMPMPYSGT